MRIRLLSCSLAFLTIVACAYYNGLYNANRLADEARKAEREGRRSEAQSLWARAAVKAESVATRYPDSRYHDDALLMQGRALREIGECREAVEPLREAVATSPDGSLRAQAGLLLGECQLSVGQPDAAAGILSTLVEHPDHTTSSRALLWRGRAAIALHAPDRALFDLRRTSEPEAVFDRAAALMTLGRADEAAAALDTARGLPYDETRWTPALDRLGAADLDAASGLVERLVMRQDLTSGERARLLMDDAQRWQRVDRGRAVERFTAAVTAAGDSLEGRLARTHLAIGAVRRTSDVSRVAALTDELGALMLEGGEIVTLAGDFASVLEGISFALGPPEPVHPDLHLFRAAEEARDSLLAPDLAASLFLLTARRHPTSVIAPKALLAAAVLRPAIADSVHDVLRQVYASSPYVRAAAGDYPPGYTALEDSIRTLLQNVVLRRGSGGG